MAVDNTSTQRMGALVARLTYLHLKSIGKAG